MRCAIIDGNALLYRCYYATLNQLAYYQQNNLQPLNALKLFLLLICQINQKKYDYMLIAFDHKDKTKRHQEFNEYKAKRKSMPQELVSQIPLILDALDRIKIQYCSISGYEADDIIGSYAKFFAKHDTQVDIYTSDKDMFQLVETNIRIIYFKTGLSVTIEIDHNNFDKHFFGLKPMQVIDFKAISGDASDNLPGVKGVGPKTTVNLLKKYNDLETIYSHIDELGEREKEKFIRDEKSAIQCKKLATIITDIQCRQIDVFINKLNINNLKTVIQQYRFNGFEKYFI
jgi:DNA polymerase-1